MNPDADLVDRLRSGAPGALDEVYRRYRDRIWRFLARLAGNTAEAEDLFQETWLAAARHAHLVREDTSLARWLYTIAHNKYRNGRRDRAADARRWEGVARTAREAHSEDSLAAHVDLGAVNAAMARLPEAFREVLLLCVCEDLSSADAAAVLGITAEAVRKRLSRARAELGAQLEEKA